MAVIDVVCNVYGFHIKSVVSGLVPSEKQNADLSRVKSIEDPQWPATTLHP